MTVANTYAIFHHVNQIEGGQFDSMVRNGASRDSTEQTLQKRRGVTA